MDNLNDLKAIWLTAKTDDLPTSVEMLRLVKKFRNQKLLKKWGIIIAALVSMALMVFTVFSYKSTMITTRIGELLAISACVILASTNIKSLKRFYDLNDCSNKEFIAFLEQTRQNQLYYYKKTQVWGMWLSSAGLLLYMYELVYRDMMLFIIIYSFSVAWILFLWLYLRPRNFKKQTLKLNKTLDKLEKISNQIK
jgi:hypothetical protein